MTDEQHSLLPNSLHHDDTQQEPWVASRDDFPSSSGTPFVQREWRRVLRFVLIGMAIVIVSFIAYSIFFGGRSTGPTLASRVDAQQQALDQLSVRIDELRSGQGSVSSRLAEVVSRVDGLAASHQELPDRLDALSHRIDDLSVSTDSKFTTVQDKVQASESALDDIRHTYSSQKPAAQTPSKPRRQARKKVSSPKLPSPPFVLSGIEMRGGRSYLSVISGQAGQLSDLRLVGEGQSIGSWQLTSIDGRSATFFVEGQTVVVPVP